MTPQNDLELQGDLRTNPSVELLAEASAAKLSGSLRIAAGDKKTIIYLKNGSVVYAVSNERRHRLFSLVLSQKKVDQKKLGSFANFANDHELASWLKDEQLLPSSDVNFLIIRQVETVIVESLDWEGGEWVFSPHARARGDMKVSIDLVKLLMEYGRWVSPDIISRRFRGEREEFTPVSGGDTGHSLLPNEQLVFERFCGLMLSLGQLLQSLPMPEIDIKRALYVLRLGGLLEQKDQETAFSAAEVDKLRTTKFKVVAKTSEAGETKAADLSIFHAKEPAAKEKPVQSEIPLSVFLDRTEKAANLYETLGVSKTAATKEIKEAYFNSARLFHPDKFRHETPENSRRLHHAFSEIARAYEMLKNEDTRSAYDFKLRKEYENSQKRVSTAALTIGENETAVGLESFEQGLAAISDDNYSSAATHLARAVHYNPQSARFHAHFGKALSAAEQYHHKAETEFQTAIRLAPANAEIRLMYVEFLIELDQSKRAEGELNRFLEIAPGNKEALALLEKLRK